ncbi:MAG: thiamine pyrophosphate-binding protein [Candidatus Ancillula sp.]|jgi:acetolactate synthase-1/2/3 large subunit|nr:thiamine pyrophosphate-binding protein [Candidatus Ancillula sp.]
MISADYIINFLIKKGIKNAYGYPGSLAGFTMEAMRKRSNEISQHLLYHEEACGFAAIGESIANNFAPAFCWTTSGPGATNVLTAIASAYYDSVPVLFLTANVSSTLSDRNLGENSNSPRQQPRQKGNQETDIVSMTTSITKMSVRINTANEVPEIIEKAWQELTTGRKGPVLIDLPIDISRTEISDAKIFLSKQSNSNNNTAEDSDKKIALLKDINSQIISANNPVILAGAGIRQAGVISGFTNWATKQQEQKTELQIVTTMLGKDLPIKSVGVVGAWGSPEVNKTLLESDLIISFGSRIAERILARNGGKFNKNQKLIRIDIDKNEINRVATPEITNTKKLILDLKNIFPHDSQDLNKVNQITTIDVGQNMQWATTNLDLKPGDRTIFDGGHGTMGSALPKAIGVYYAGFNNIRVVTGDGGLQMCSEELHYIAQHNLPIKIYLLNNNSLGLIRQFQDNNFASQYFSTTEQTGFSSPNWEALSKAYGLDYKLSNSRDFINEDKSQTSKPTLIEIEL